MGYKGKSFWYTVSPSDVVVDSIYAGRKQVARSEQQVPVLDYVFLPDTPVRTMVIRHYRINNLTGEECKDFCLQQQITWLNRILNS